MPNKYIIYIPNNGICDWMLNGCGIIFSSTYNEEIIEVCTDKTPIDYKNYY